MPTSIRTETETVIKKILPYLTRREYQIETDFDFETAVRTTDRYQKGYVDILVTCGKAKPQFLVEAKKASKRLTIKDRDQAIGYAQSFNVPFVVVTNGTEIQCFNTENRLPIKWNGKLDARIPTKSQLRHVLTALKINKHLVDVPLSGDTSLPFRPGLPLKQLNSLFARCHNAIRKIEKDEEHAFADFSKMLFLKLLEEKVDTSNFEVPYTYRFHLLAEKPETEADQVKDAVFTMIKAIKEKTTYGDVLEAPVHLKNPRTFRHIVRELSAVSFFDSSIDSKGAAFEYFVRATLKGKKLGQYFTPRPLVVFMSHLVGHEKILSAVKAGDAIKVLDPACGTGGFLVFLMQSNLEMLSENLKRRKITKQTHDKLFDLLMRRVFYGSDANEGVACAAKMNMIIAGDGHTNIQPEDSLAASAKNWGQSDEKCDLILTNPPFGTSETDSLTKEDLAAYPVRSGKGQHLFLQRMVLNSKPGGEICTVIDEGVLNTESATDLRRWLLQHVRMRAVVRLPEETFKPNKINVRSSLLFMERLETDDLDLEADYKVTFCDLRSLGYAGSGDPIRGFDFELLLREAADSILDQDKPTQRTGYNWMAYDVDVQSIIGDSTCRIDLKYWRPEIRTRISALNISGGQTLRELNTIVTSRGISPSADLYVDEAEGYALVVKAGSNISKFGELIASGDYIEKSLYDEYMEASEEAKRNFNIVKRGDVLLASTGDGTLGKCCVYGSDRPAVADGHVTIIRVDSEAIDPDFLCDYLRVGFGARQIERLYTGSTGLVELTPDHVDSIVVDISKDRKEQKRVSTRLRAHEQAYQVSVGDAEGKLAEARRIFSA